MGGEGDPQAAPTSATGSLRSFRKAEVFIIGMHITPLTAGYPPNVAMTDLTRTRAYPSAGISKLIGKVERSGYALVPLISITSVAASRRPLTGPRARSSTTSARSRKPRLAAKRRASCATRADRSSALVEGEGATWIEHIPDYRRQTGLPRAPAEHQLTNAATSDHHHGSRKLMRAALIMVPKPMVLGSTPMPT